MDEKDLWGRKCSIALARKGESSEVEGPKSQENFSLSEKERKLKEIYGHRAPFAKRPFRLGKWFPRPTSNLIIYGLNCVYECPCL